LTVEQLRELSSEITAEFEHKRTLGNIEYPLGLSEKHVYGLEFSLTPEELAEEIFRHTHRGARVEPGVEDVFKQIEDAGIPMGVVSNSGFTAQAVFTHAREFDLDRYFEFMISTSDYIFRIPDPRVLLTACKMIGHQPGDVWYVGNSIENDLVAANRAGMPAIWYNAVNQTPAPPAPQRPSHRGETSRIS